MKAWPAEQRMLYRSIWSNRKSNEVDCQIIPLLSFLEHLRENFLPQSHKGRQEDYMNSYNLVKRYEHSLHRTTYPDNGLGAKRVVQGGGGLLCKTVVHRSEAAALRQKICTGSTGLDQTAVHCKRVLDPVAGFLPVTKARKAERVRPEETSTKPASLSMAGSTHTLDSSMPW